jgi:hypothetical protein
MPFTRDDKLNLLREAVRTALKEYESGLNEAIGEAESSEREDLEASVIEVGCAKRVLWMERD